MIYHVLLVEDEPVIRESIKKSIHWDRMPIQLAAEAENGREALAYMQTMPIDIVITDMRMPVCDGSQMLKQMESLHYNCEIIVLSEYSDFSYMYQAIHAHVFDYLLKPIDPAQLNRLLQELVERLALRAPAAEAEEPLHTLFHKAMTGTLCDPKNAWMLQQYAGKTFAACCMRLRRKSDADAWRERIVQKIKQAPFASALFPYSTTEPVFCMLSMIGTACTHQTGRKYLEFVQTLMEQVSEGTAFRTGLSGFGYGVSDVKAAIDEAASMLQYIGRKPGILYQKGVSSYTPYLLPSPINESQLISFLSASDNFSAQCMTMLLRTIESRAYLYLPAVRHLLIDFTMSVEKCCQKIGYGVDISELLGRNYIDQINQIAWEDEIPQYLQDMLQAVAACLADRHTPNTRQTLQLILRTVQTQYMEELSLIDFSQKYHLNYIYLSRKFKDMVGLTFTEYLLQIRMNKAKELIEENGMSEKAAAPLVGYSNPYYFSSCYRKYFETNRST